MNRLCIEKVDSILGGVREIRRQNYILRGEGLPKPLGGISGLHQRCVPAVPKRAKAFTSQFTRMFKRVTDALEQIVFKTAMAAPLGYFESEHECRYGWK